MMTNFERIQIMEPYKLAMFLWENNGCNNCLIKSSCEKSPGALECIDHVVEWLESEAE